MIKPRPTYLLAVALCAQPEAQTFFEAGFAAQQKGESDGAIAAYQKCLEIDPSCVSCRYELGWSYWKKNDFRAVVREWKTVLAQAEGTLPPEITEKLKESLPVAESRAEGSKRPPAHPPLGTRSEPAASPVSLELVARFQSYDPKGDSYDLEVSSPKSAAAHPRKPWVYIQSLEAKKTLVFDTRTRAKVGTVSHDFKAEQASLFAGLSEPPGVRFPDSIDPATRNVFSGKPVEAAFSHGGRYLYVPYYRREYDTQGTLPSAMAVIDTRKRTGGEIVRVLPTGPISKYVATAPNGKILAVSNWGDNTLHLLDISSKTAKGFRYLARLVVEKPLPLEGITAIAIMSAAFASAGWPSPPTLATFLSRA